MHEVDDNNFSAREAAKLRKRDLKRKTSMVVDGASMRQVLINRAAKTPKKSKGSVGTLEG